MQHLQPPRAERDNHFNLIRLVLASLVILSHAPELLDGDRHRELLTRAFGTLSFGELAVDGFFILSGFLICQSWTAAPKFRPFLVKRVLRIFPGFIAASLVCALLIPVFVTDLGTYFGRFRWDRFSTGMVLLRVPVVPTIFARPYAGVNGSVWTIEYEFRCYLLVAALGLIGLLRRRWVVVLLAAACLAAGVSPLGDIGAEIGVIERLLGGLRDSYRLSGLFLTGASFYLFRDRILYRGRYALAAAVALLGCAFTTATVTPAVAVFGGYLLFWFAGLKHRPLDVFKRMPDVSYGIYLYGWPVEKLLIFAFGSLSPWVLAPLALGLAGVCGWVSRHLVESPCLRLKPRRDLMAFSPAPAGDFARVDDGRAEAMAA